MLIYQCWGQSLNVKFCIWHEKWKVTWFSCAKSNIMQKLSCQLTVAHSIMTENIFENILCGGIFPKLKHRFLTWMSEQWSASLEDEPTGTMEMWAWDLLSTCRDHRVDSGKAHECKGRSDPELRTAEQMEEHVAPFRDGESVCTLMLTFSLLASFLT